MNIELLTKHHLEFLSLQACLSLFMSKYHIVGNRMSRLEFIYNGQFHAYCVKADGKIHQLTKNK